MDDDVPAQGWCLDPFGIHEHRWISKGRPTALVRDGSVEGNDEPPSRPPELPLVPVSGAPLGDTRRADDANRQSLPDSGSYRNIATAGSAVYGSMGGGPAPSGITGWQTSFEHKMRKRAKKQRRDERWHRWFGSGK